MEGEEEKGMLDCQSGSWGSREKGQDTDLKNNYITT
jgi:hypothetical protein